MPFPSSTLATLRPELGSSFTAFDLAMSQKGFVAKRVLPVIDVQIQAGPFGKIKLESLLQQRNTKRGPGGNYSRQNYEFTTDSFATVENGAEEPVDDREAKMYGLYFAAEQMAALRARDVTLRTLEQRTAINVFNTSVWTGGSLTGAVGTPWSNTANSTPIEDVDAGVKRVYDNSGLLVNALVINWHVFKNLRTNQEIISRIKYSGDDDPKNVTVNMLAAIFDIEQVIVAGAQYNSANEGQQATLAPLWGDSYGMLCRIAQTDDIAEPCIGRIFHWAADGSNIGGVVESYRDETVRANIVRSRMDTQEKILYPQAGYLLSNLT